uniref:RING-type domain-containing protein n=1 Tax=Fibrocapsa japonica TaxID=94617 RepID=A0A7S2XUD8_9STRA|mmetsp:Transcript_12877/g.19007  ORF Transcript_12877/g.19007 Transcript_12877/m.19007 type:complete len:444 (+) Transcript_12877:82-1413(+)|eukprot:CAMPEP_0113944702 /NCGR_PEP_ID=MMETSP1339-20121228/35857_1 /TAXON_ID=94617 /ORGANISM="Fibrocapsa japonica" /LENGTH=443 /DNA_ID=CAMNT_0000949993 /DNA_START=56 /DNA_END=1387 /DNA_ORIENTATION=- /assembly_acc=CAM_ASM_000762
MNEEEQGKDASSSEQEVEEVPQELECTLCLKLLYEPVSLPCGHSFCRRCLRRALTYKKECPLCRAACLPGAASNAVNIALETFASSRLPKAWAARKQECEEEDDEDRQADAQAARVLSGRSQASPASAAVPEEGSGVSHTVPLFLFPLQLVPHQPMIFQFFEPRYVVMVERLLAGNRLFGLQPSASEDRDGPPGLLMMVEQCQQIPGPHTRYVVQTKVASRYTIQDPSSIVEEPGTMGLHYATVQPYDDIQDDASLSPRVKELSLEAWDLTSTLLDSLPNHAKRMLLHMCGPLPSRGQHKRLSFWLASALRLREGEPLGLLRTRDLEMRVRQVSGLLAKRWEQAQRRSRGAEYVFRNQAPGSQAGLFSSSRASLLLLLGLVLSLVLLRFGDNIFSGQQQPGISTTIGRAHSPPEIHPSDQRQMYEQPRQAQEPQYSEVSSDEL